MSITLTNRAETITALITAMSAKGWSVAPGETNKARIQRATDIDVVLSANVTDGQLNDLVARYL